MRRHQVTGTVTPLHLAQPRVAGPSGDGLRSIGTEGQLTDLERQLVALRQLADRPRDRPAVRPNAVIDVGHDEREASSGVRACSRSSSATESAPPETATSATRAPQEAVRARWVRRCDSSDVML